jgi:hypothetical protein
MYKHKVGDTLTLQIGDRPLLHLTILECVARAKKPHYRVDWAKAGYHEMLNTISLPETAFNRRDAAKL